MDLLGADQTDEEEEAEEEVDEVQEEPHVDGLLVAEWSTAVVRDSDIPALLCHKDTAQGTLDQKPTFWGIYCLWLCCYGMISGFHARK